jgi:hypothetical protein
MAINKNFAVRHGLEVATNLILADSVTGKVGIASTGPRTELDVRGGIAATDLTIVGVATIATLKLATGIVTDLTVENATIGISTVNRLNSTYINSSGVTTVSLLNVTGITTIAVGIVTNLSGTNLNYSGIGTVRNLNVTGIATIAVGIVTDLSGTNLNYSGIGTIATVDINAGDIEVTSVRTSNFSATGVSTIASLSVTGSTFDTLTVNNFSTLNGVTTVTNANIVNLNVTGIATVANIDINGGDIEVSNVDTVDLNVTGIGTIATVDINGGDIEVSNVDTVDLNVTGISTLGTVKVSSGIITATSGIVTYYGDGAYLQNISAGIGIGTTGGLVGYAVTFINFYGTGVSTALYDSNVGVATIFFEGGGSGTIGIGTLFPPSANSNGDLFYNANYGRLFVYYDESVIGVGTDAYWVDAAPFNVGILTGSFSQLRVGSATTFTEELVVGGDARVTGILTIGTGTLTIDSSGNIYTSGIITAFDFDTLSDFNYKTNILPIENSLDIVSEMRGVKFNWKESNRPSYGVIAQELQEVLPELVHGDDPKTVNYNGIIGVLIEAIKELKDEIDMLKKDDE